MLLPALPWFAHTPAHAVSPADWLLAHWHASAASAESGVVVALVALNLMLAGCTGVFLAAGMVTRWARAFDHARRERFAARWEPYLHGRIAGDTEPLPPLPRHEQVPFLMLWLHLAGYLQGEGEEGLRAIGIETGITSRVIALLDARPPWKRLLGARAAALLLEPRARPALLRLAAGRDRKLALAAVEALLRIDPPAGDEQFRVLLLRGGWSPGMLVNTASANPAATGHAIEQALANAPAGKATAIIRLIGLIDNAAATPALRARLLGNRDEGETAALLHALGRFGAEPDRLAALSFIKDTRWPVRMQAAFALGQLGQPQDMDRLARLLGDTEWWVRYRAAQAMLRLARGDRAALALAMDKVTDRFARDAMAFAVAEFEWHPAQ